MWLLVNCPIMALSSRSLLLPDATQMESSPWIFSCSGVCAGRRELYLSGRTLVRIICRNTRCSPLQMMERRERRLYVLYTGAVKVEVRPDICLPGLLGYSFPSIPRSRLGWSFSMDCLRCKPGKQGLKYPRKDKTRDPPATATYGKGVSVCYTIDTLPFASRSTSTSRLSLADQRTTPAQSPHALQTQG